MVFGLKVQKKDAENIWKYAQKFIELDSKKKEGNELDEFWSHKFLESLGETLTIIQLREKLRKIDVDMNGKMSLIEYLIFKYNKGIEATVNAPQGGNEEEIKKAQAELMAVQTALETFQQKLEEQRKGEEELKVAVDNLKMQEDSFNNQIKELTRKSEQDSSVVGRNKAKQELAQLKQENPLPLRKAKITQEASLRKVEKQRKETEDAVIRTEVQMKEAQEFLETVKRKGGSGFGSIWWMERELLEVKKYLPKRMQ